jgi:release factor glutamine methyltransferase
MARLGFDTAALDAKRLAAHALGLSDLQMATREGEPADIEAASRLAGMMQRRLAGESVARIVGEREFYGLPFCLNAATLEPRPDTELLVDLALGAIRPGGRLLDLGTGTGCIPIAILVNAPGVDAVAVDLSGEALKAARQNAERHNVLDRLQLLEGSWFEPLTQHPLPNPPHKGEGAGRRIGLNSVLSTEQHLPPGGGDWEGGRVGPDSGQSEPRFDLIVSNPPYIETATLPTLAPEVADFDPPLALDGGPDGLAPYRIIAAQAPGWLNSGGRLMVEIGYNQAKPVSDLFAKAGFSAIAVHKDLAGLDRVVSGHHI